MLRDYKLRMVLEEGEQLPLELEGFHTRMTQEFGSVVIRYVVGPLAVWEFTSYHPKDTIKQRLNRLVPTGFRWWVESENRSGYANVTPKEIELLLDATGFRGQP